MLAAANRSLGATMLDVLEHAHGFPVLTDAGAEAPADHGLTLRRPWVAGDPGGGTLAARLHVADPALSTVTSELIGATA